MLRFSATLGAAGDLFPNFIAFSLPPVNVELRLQQKPQKHTQIHSSSTQTPLVDSVWCSEESDAVGRMAPNCPL